MIVLAFDLSGNDITVGIEVDGKLTQAVYTASEKERHRAPIPAIDSVLKKTGTGLDDLDMVAFGAGPGYFSGIRIACATAQAICQINKCQIRPVNTMLALAQETGKRKVICALPAHQEHYFIAIYSEIEGLMSAEVPVGLFSIKDLPKLGDTGWTSVGKGFGERHPDLSEHYSRFIEGHCNKDYPSAGAIISVAKTHFPQNVRLDPLRVTPLYARDKVAFTVEEQKAGKQGGNGRG